MSLVVTYAEISTFSEGLNVNSYVIVHCWKIYQTTVFF